MESISRLSLRLARSLPTRIHAHRPKVACHSPIEARLRTQIQSVTLTRIRHASNTVAQNTMRSKGSDMGKSKTEMDSILERKRRQNQTAMNYIISVMLGTVALSYGSVPLYKMVCQTTGWGGQPIRVDTYTTATGADPATRMVPVTDVPRIKVQFSASVSDVLPWRFVPQQRQVQVLPGETALAFYKAYNNSDKDIIGVATYSVTPAQVAPYFSKIQCFCFEEQRLNAGEEVDMPVFFYLDPDLLNDINMKGIETVTLHYTFFKARYDDNGTIKRVPLPSPI